MEPLFIHNIEPTLLKLGPMQIRYYGLLFASSVVMVLFVLRYLFKVKGYRAAIADDYIIYALIGLIIGSRIIHVLFYHTSYYFSNPVEILRIWKGGIASHGATLGVVLGTIVFYIRRKELSIYKMLDLIAIPIALATAFIRLGNFMNAEIVGRVADLPWTVAYKYQYYQVSGKIFYYYKSLLSVKDSFLRSIMMKYYSLTDDKLDAMLSEGKDVALQKMVSELPRHPTQIYEMSYGIIVFLMLYLLFRLYRDRLRDGVLFYSFFVGYFSFRFLVEFVKEYQTLIPKYLTMGQYLSIPFIVVGIIMIIVLQKGQARQAN